MRTEYYTVSFTDGEIVGGVDGDSDVFAEVAELIRGGAPVAFPTETVYGLGANAFDEQAVARVFAAKGRPADNPLIVHVADRQQLDLITMTPNEWEQRLMAAFWPGPLTLVLPVKPGVLPGNVTAGLDTVAVRQPAHPVALTLLQACGVPLAAPSANRSGKPSPTTALHVKDDLDGMIAAILDGGPTEVGIESTVIRCTADEVHILRPGTVTAEQLEQALPGIRVAVVADLHNHNDLHVADYIPPSPGMKYAHYAPKGELLVVEANNHHEWLRWVSARLQEAKSQGHRTGLLAFADKDGGGVADVVVVAGDAAHPETVARALYDALRTFDREQVTFIIAETCPATGVGAAVMNRLLKAAGHRFLRI